VSLLPKWDGREKQSRGRGWAKGIKFVNPRKVRKINSLTQIASTYCMDVGRIFYRQRRTTGVRRPFNWAMRGGDRGASSSVHDNIMGKKTRIMGNLKGVSRKKRGSEPTCRPNQGGERVGANSNCLSREDRVEEREYKSELS